MAWQNAKVKKEGRGRLPRPGVDLGGTGIVVGNQGVERRALGKDVFGSYVRLHRACPSHRKEKLLGRGGLLGLSDGIGIVGGGGEGKGRHLIRDFGMAAILADRLRVPTHAVSGGNNGDGAVVGQERERLGGGLPTGGATQVALPGHRTGGGNAPVLHHLVLPRARGDDRGEGEGEGGGAVAVDVLCRLDVEGIAKAVHIHNQTVIYRVIDLGGSCHGVIGEDAPGGADIKRVPPPRNPRGLFGQVLQPRLPTVGDGVNQGSARKVVNKGVNFAVFDAVRHPIDKGEGAVKEVKAA